jgi:hypothetical protein
MSKAVHHSDGVDLSIHANGMTSGSITMVVVFVGCLCCCE